MYLHIGGDVIDVVLTVFIGVAAGVMLTVKDYAKKLST